jgi:Protein of unknown function (DUF3489)
LILLAYWAHRSDECHDRITPAKTKKDFMPAFTIDRDNNITYFSSSKDIERSAEEIETFSDPQELAALAEQWPGVRLVEAWNSLPGVEPVQRFTSRQVAVSRIWKAIQSLKATGGAPARTVAPKKGNAHQKASRRAQPAVRENSKKAQVMALLQQPQGATLEAILRDTGWQAHSVRGFISGQLGKKMGLRVRSFQRDGQRVYELNG